MLSNDIILIIFLIKMVVLLLENIWQKNLKKERSNTAV